MKKIVFVLGFVLLSCFAYAQKAAAEAAKKFIRQGDYANAILVLNSALAVDEHNVDMKKDLAYAYYLPRDFTKAILTIRPLIESNEADAHSFQIAGMIYEAVEDRREAERIYRSGIRKFSSSGVLYNAYGELLWGNVEYGDAIRQWLRGIQNDPNHSSNYYNAAKYYYLSTDKVWGLIYGEIFVNLESYSKRTPEVKTMLLEGYKKLFSETDLQKNQDNKSNFVKAYLDIMKNQVHTVNAGITPDALSALRTRFLLEWFDKHAAKLPYRLFEYQRQLARAGLFDAYNQWIFGAANNLSSFQQWTVTHNEAYSRFTQFQKNRVFKVPEGQYYQVRP